MQIVCNLVKIFFFAAWRLSGKAITNYKPQNGVLKMNIKKSFVLFFILIFAGSLLASDYYTKDFSKTVDFRSNGDIRVKTVNGKIDVTSWDKESVKIEAEIKVKARNRRDADKILDKVKIVIDKSSCQLTIEADYPKKRGDDSFWDALFNWNGKKPVVHFTIKVPRETNLDLRSTNGHVSAADVKGDNSLSTTNGGIEADGMAGSLDIRTTNGSVVAVVSVFGDRDKIRLKTTNGSVKLRLPTDVRADVTASTVNGAIRTDFPLTIQGKIMKRKISGEINGGGGNIDISTVNGSVKIYEL